MTRKSASFIIYLIIFHAFWMGAFVFGIYPWMKSLGERSLLYALINVSLRLLVWVLPVFLYLKYIDGVNPIDYLKLSQNWKRGLIVGLALSLLNLLGSMIRFGWPQLTPHTLTWNSVISTSILIGFIEEIPYRGFMLQKFTEYWGFWIAALLSSLLFLSMHLPGWISLHLFRFGNAITVFAFGLVMAIVLRYTKSLWAPIITHSTNDFIALVLFHL
ncbi:MAG TPA: type II CAAX endopeptidase family protein [Pyrinomonadaceae bacterium]|nr:type II CAAX endopeptidase family protein [Pyrinomonadaceae bacterium]